MTRKVTKKEKTFASGLLLRIGKSQNERLNRSIKQKTNASDFIFKGTEVEKELKG